MVPMHRPPRVRPTGASVGVPERQPSGSVPGRPHPVEERQRCPVRRSLSGTPWAGRQYAPPLDLRRQRERVLRIRCGGVAAFGLVGPGGRGVLVVGHRWRAGRGGQRVEVEEVGQAGMEQHVVRAGRSGATDRVGMRLAVGGRAKSAGRPTALIKKTSSSPQSAELSLGTQQRSEAGLARAGGVGHRPAPAGVEVIGQHEKVVGGGAVLGDDLLGRRDAVRAAGVRVEVAAEPASVKSSAGPMPSTPSRHGNTGSGRIGAVAASTQTR